MFQAEIVPASCLHHVGNLPVYREHGEQEAVHGGSSVQMTVVLVPDSPEGFYTMVRWQLLH